MLTKYLQLFTLFLMPEQRLSEGMAVLGCIREIQMTELIISLPNSLNGYIPITHINDHFNSQINASMAADTEVVNFFTYVP